MIRFSEDCLFPSVPYGTKERNEAMNDHIEAIAIGIESLGFDIGTTFERRAKASFIEQALKLSGFQIAALSHQSGEGRDAAGQLLCAGGCGRLYSKGPDLVISDADWMKIAPRPDGGGVLCPNCMHDRFVAIGVRDYSIAAQFTSGPFALPPPQAPQAEGWRPIKTFDGMDMIDRVDLWLHIYPSPRSMGMSDSFRVTDAYRKNGKWFHQCEGREAELFADYITHWQPLPAPPLVAEHETK